MNFSLIGNTKPIISNDDLCINANKRLSRPLANTGYKKKINTKRNMYFGSTPLKNPSNQIKKCITTTNKQKKTQKLP